MSCRMRELTDPGFLMPDESPSSAFIELRREFEDELQPFVQVKLVEQGRIDEVSTRDPSHT